MAMDSIGNLLTGGMGMEPIPGNYQPPPQAQGGTPPASPQEVEQNKGLWRNFLSRLDDPNVRQALLVTGINLLRSPQYGQNSGDIAANALTAGVGTLQQLRERERAQKNLEQQRADTQAQRTVENQQGQQRIDISRSQQQTYGEQVRQQGAASERLDTREAAQSAETARHNRATEANQRLAAMADMARAKAYAAGGTGKTPQDIQKINILAAHYMQTEGLDETSAKAKAVMVVDSTGTAKSPGEQARMLYQERLKAWGNDIGNIGKTLTTDQARELLESSMNDIMQLQQFNASAATGGPLPGTRSGPIQRDGSGAAPPATGGSPVGTVKGGYRKAKPGPDNVKENWEKVQNGN